MDEARLEGDFGLRLGGTGFTLTLPSPVEGEGEHGMGIGYQRGGDWSTQNAACGKGKRRKRLDLISVKAIGRRWG